MYQAASEAGNAEDSAKDNQRDSLSLFGQVFKWKQWIGQKTCNPETNKTTLQGILPFVKHLLQEKLEVNISKSFIRNLLNTAQQQELMVEERQWRIDELEQHQSISEQQTIQFLKQEQDDIRTYLHLPKIVYTLARLPSHIRNSESFEPVRLSLIHHDNASYFRAIATWLDLLTRKSNP